MRREIKVCNGCECLMHEKAAKGSAGYQRCMKAGRYAGRVVDYSPIDEFVITYTPKWCKEGTSVYLDFENENRRA